MSISDKLINFIEGIENNINKIIVCTGKRNLPAINLYLKNGYNKKSDIEIGSGIYITEFEEKLR